MSLAKAPSHILFHRHSIYFRRRIPSDICHLINRREIRISLGTNNMRKARHLAACLTTRTNEAFDWLRGCDTLELTDTQIRAMVDKWLRDELEAAENARLARTKPFSHAQLISEATSIGEYRKFAKEALIECNYTQISDTVDELLKVNNITTTGTMQRNKLCRELLRASETYFEVEGRRMAGDYSTDLQQAVVETQPAPSTSQQTLDKGPTLREAVKLFIEDKMNEGWTAHTKRTESFKVELFADVVGDIPCSELRIDHIRKYKKFAYNYPRNKAKIAKYKDLTIQQLMEMEIPQDDRIGDTTIENYFKYAKSFLLWMETNELITSAKIGRILVVKNKNKKRANEFRDNFSKEDLEAIFNPENFKGYYRKREPHKYWVPLISLYTGARLEEICQLTCNDIVKEDDTWCFSLFESEGDDKRFKTSASQRFVPIAPILIEKFKLLDYVEAVKGKGHKLLFPELNNENAQEKFSAKFTKSFGKYLRSIGIKNESRGRKCFHSFRHTLSYWCDTNGMAEKSSGRLIGHEHNSLTFGRYSKDTKPSILYRDIVSRLDFGVDLSGYAEINILAKIKRKP